MSKKNGGPAPSEQVYIEYWPLSKFVPAQRNPKLHDLEEIALSIRRFGFVSPGVVNEATGRAVVGHGRVDALALYKERHDKGEDGWTTVPRRIVEKDGEWWFPVERGVSFDSDAEAEAYLLADNQLTFKGGWNEPLQLDALKDMGDFTGIGFNTFDIDLLKSRLGELEMRPDFAGLIEKFQEAAPSKAEGDEKWFYIEFYGDDKTFQRVLKQVTPYLKGQRKHEIEGKYFVQMVRAFLAAKKES